MIFNSQLKPIYKGAAQIVGETSNRHDVNPKAPADLKDSNPLWNYTSDGSPVSSLLLPQDFERGVDSPMGSITIAAIAIAILVLSGIIAGIVYLAHGNALHGFIWSAAVMSIIGMVLFGTTTLKAGGLAVLMSPPFALFGIIGSIFFSTKPKGDRKFFGMNRGEALFDQTQSDGSSYTYQQDWQDIVRIKQAQAKDAIADTSPFIELGSAMGHLTRHGDPLAPDYGTEVGYTVNDMSTHTILLGKTGTGKTVAIKKIAKQLFEKTMVGALVMCGKGALAAALAGFRNYVLLNPENAKLALFQGMSAMEVTEALAVKNEHEDAFFYASARTLVKNSAVVLKALADAKVEGYKFTPKNLLTMLNSNGGSVEVDGKKTYTKHGEYRAAALSAASALEVDGVKIIDKGGMLSIAVEYFEAEFQSIQKAGKTLAGVMMLANIWLEPLFTNELIADWANCDEGEDITACLEGARIGIDVPATIYGQAASAIITNLVRMRLYSALKKRGDNWKSVEGQTPVLVLIDEMHLLWQAESGDGMDDNSMVSIGRSLGAMFLVGTQSIDEMESRFNEEKTLASLGNFRNLICYEATTKTLEYASSMAGAILRPINTINLEDGEVKGMNMTAALNQEMIAPKDFGGRLGGDASSFAKKMVRNTPLHYLVGIQSQGMSHQNRETGAVGNNARATYMSASSDELQIMLQERFCALAVLNRAGAPRRDVIYIEPPHREAARLAAEAA